MKRVLITIRRRGAPARRIVGLYRSTTDAVIHGIDLAGDEPCSISAEVLA